MPPYGAPEVTAHRAGRGLLIEGDREAVIGAFQTGIAALGDLCLANREMRATSRTTTNREGSAQRSAPGRQSARDSSCRRDSRPDTRHRKELRCEAPTRWHRPSRHRCAQLPRRAQRAVPRRTDTRRCRSSWLPTPQKRQLAGRARPNLGPPITPLSTSIRPPSRLSCGCWTITTRPAELRQAGQQMNDQGQHVAHGRDMIGPYWILHSL